MSYTQSIYHMIIRTKANKLTLPLEHSEELYRYIWGIIKNKNGLLYRVNGIEDHVHILFALHPTIALSDFARDLKAETSKMLKRTAGFEQFTAWSEGYTALSCNLRDKDIIINYTKNQREHHKTILLNEEYIAVSQRNGIGIR